MFSDKVDPSGDSLDQCIAKIQDRGPLRDIGMRLLDKLTQEEREGLARHIAGLELAPAPEKSSSSAADNIRTLWQLEIPGAGTLDATGEFEGKNLYEVLNTMETWLVEDEEQTAAERRRSAPPASRR